MGGLRLQSVTTAIAVVLALLAGVASFSLFWLTSELHAGTRLLARNTESVAISEDLEIALLEHNRAANVARATGDPVESERTQKLEGELEELLERAARSTGEDPGEQRRLGTLRAAVRRYLVSRQQLEASDLRLSELVTQLRPSHDTAIEASQELRRYNEVEMTRAQGAAERLDQVANVLALSISATMLLLIGAMLYAVRRYVVIPLMGIREAISRWRAHDDTGRAPPRGLRDTQEIAEAFNDMAGELSRQRRAQLTFLAGVAHDLRNPLEALSLATETLHEDGATPGPDTDRLLALLSRQVKRLNRMISDLLDAARIEAGYIELEIERIDLREPAREIAELYTSVSAAHRIHVAVPTEPVTVRADPLRIEQVISNLVSNAIKYSPAGGDVRISVEARDEEVTIAVSDEGDGIPAADLETIFEPFRRRKETKETAPGVGLGLSVVRRIVEAHGGSIHVESAPGTGSVFRVRLPRRTRTAVVVDPEDVLGRAPAVRAPRAT